MPAQDLLVKLWNLPPKEPVLARLRARGVAVKRVIAPDRGRVLAFVKERFGDGWMHECEAALSTVPSTCYVAVKDLTKGGDIIRGVTYSPFMPLIAVALIYLVMVMFFSWLVGKLERRLRNSDH